MTRMIKPAGTAVYRMGRVADVSPEPTERPCLHNHNLSRMASSAAFKEEFGEGLRFERIGKGQYYNVVFHIGSTYVPVSDETVEELKGQSLLPAERFLELLVDRIGYSSYLKDQIRTELRSSGDPVTQITVLQGAIREL